MDHGLRDPSRPYVSRGPAAPSRPNGTAPSPSKMHRNAMPSPTAGGSFRRSPTNSDDSASSAGRRNAVVAKYGSDARNALERIRRCVNEDPFIAANSRGAPTSARLASQARTSLGLQLNGGRVTGVVKGSPAFLTQRFNPGDEVLAVDGVEVAPADVAKAIVGSDKPGSVVRLQVRGGASRRVEEVEVAREEVEVVKMQRAVFEGLEQLSENTPDAALRSQVDALVANLTKAQVRTYEQQTEVRHVVAAQQETARQAVDEVYANVGKLEGAYSGVQGRTARLSDEVERLGRELGEAKGHAPGGGGRGVEVGASPEMNPEGREVALLQAKMESLVSELAVVRRQRDQLHDMSLRGGSTPPQEEGLLVRVEALEEENKQLALALERRGGGGMRGLRDGDAGVQDSMERVELLARSQQGLGHYGKYHGEPGSPHHDGVYGARPYLHAPRGDGFRSDLREEEFHQREPQGGLGSGFFHLEMEDGGRLQGEHGMQPAYVSADQPGPLPSIVDEMAM